MSVSVQAQVPAPVVYLSFDDTWNNDGTAGPELPTHVGSVNGTGPKFNINGIKGSCLELNVDPIDPNMGSLVYGTAGLSDTAMEVALQDLRSFTIMGWLHSDNALGGRVLQRPSDDPNIFADFSLFPISTSGLRLLINDSNNSAGSSSYAIRGRWFFFAVTYNADWTFNGVVWYEGKGRDPNDFVVSSFDDLLTPQDVLGTHHSQIIIGNSVIDKAGSFNGKIDELRIFGSKTDGSGELNFSEIKAFYAEGFLPKCGDASHPFPLGDLDKNCIVDWNDLKILVENWLAETVL